MYSLNISILQPPLMLNFGQNALTMNRILREPLAEYITAKNQPFKQHNLSSRLRTDFPNIVKEILPNRQRYTVVGSAGKGQWTDVPWIAILDTFITESPQSGYYPVLLFKKDMSGVYLSLNQGVTEVKESYKRSAKNVLKLRAADFRAKIDISDQDVLEINLGSTSQIAKLYESGNIIARYYSAESIPNAANLQLDILRFMHVYEELAYNDPRMDEGNGLTVTEKKRYRLHLRIERNSGISQKVKDLKGYTCEACDFDFKSKYGDLGKKFIEAHHLTPISSLDIGEFTLDIQTQFAVLCSNCHSMIHRLPDPSNLEQLREIIQEV